MLEIHQLCKQYKTFALGPIDLSLEAGQVYGLIGANGAGKTTLFRSVMSLIHRDSGEVHLSTQVVDGSSGAWKQQVGYVGDNPSFFDHWSGGDNLYTFARFYHHWSTELAQSLAHKFELDLNLKVGQYSTGQRAKLAIVCALAQQPTLLLLDEPANGLDPVSRDNFTEMLYDYMQQDDRCIFYATHHIADIASLIDQWIFLRQGNIVARENSEDLRENWRQLSFMSSQNIEKLPNEISRKHQGKDYQVISSDYLDSLKLLDQQGVSPVEACTLTTEQICVNILKQLEGESA